MYYEVISTNRVGGERIHEQDFLSFAKAFQFAEQYLSDNPEREIRLFIISEENLEDVDCEGWSAEELKDRRFQCRHFVWDEGIQDA